MRNGWIKFHRKFLNHPLWKEARELSKAEAWIHLILYSSIDAVTLIEQGKTLDLKRGEMIVSERNLSVQWSWSRGKVRRFLTYLKRCQMITTRTQNNTTILFIVNYGYYQSQENTKKTKKSEAKDNIPPKSASERFKGRHGI